MANKNFNQDTENQNQKDKKNIGGQQQDQKGQKEQRPGQVHQPDVKDPLRKGQNQDEQREPDTDNQED